MRNIFRNTFRNNTNTRRIILDSVVQDRLEKGIEDVTIVERLESSPSVVEGRKDKQKNRKTTQQEGKVVDAKEEGIE